MFKKLLSLAVIPSFVLTAIGPLPQANAQPLLGLPEPGAMVSLSPAYEPVIIKGLTVHKDNPFLFDFIVDRGQDQLEGEALKKEGAKLIKYFLASLAITQQDLWVNLSPYEKDKIAPKALGQTGMGRDLLSQDYILKQLTASLIYPEKQLGREFWDRVYAKARAQFGTAQIPVNTFNKVWIVADRADVFEHGQTVFVVDSHLKVMLEEDYLALTRHGGRARSAAPGTHNIASQTIRAVIIPELEHEVNYGRNFAVLRQIVNSLILANWYKDHLKQDLLSQFYADKEKIKGIDLKDKTIKEKIYQRYMDAYKKGVFNFIKEDTSAGVTVARKYFSGGFVEGQDAVRPRSVDMAMFTSVADRWQGRRFSRIRAVVMTAVKKATQLVPTAKPIIVEDLDRQFTQAFFITPNRRWLGIRDEDLIRLIRYLDSRAVFASPTAVFKRAYAMANALERILIVESTNTGVNNAILSQFSQLFGFNGLEEVPFKEENEHFVFREYRTSQGRAYLSIIRDVIRDEFEAALRARHHTDISNIHPADAAMGGGREGLDRRRFLALAAGLPFAQFGDPSGYNVIDEGARHDGTVSYADIHIVKPLDKTLESIAQDLIKSGKLKTKIPNLNFNLEPFPYLYPLKPFERLKIGFYRIDVGPDKLAQQEYRSFMEFLDNYYKSVDAAMVNVGTVSAAKGPGGIDLTGRGMRWTVGKDGQGVQMDPAMLERVKHEGIAGLTPVILSITPLFDIWSAAGLPAAGA